MSVFSAIVLLILVMDPIGNIPFFLLALKNVEQKRQQRIILRELSIALCVLVVFLLAGQYVLHVLHISEPSLTISGGIILFLISIRMIFPSKNGMLEDSLNGEPFIVPLAIPYLAGPAAMAAVMFIANRDPDRWPEWLLALIIACVFSGLILYFASALSRYLGTRGIIAIERLMGMILVTISVQMLMTGISKFLALPT
jgi:multiple antibiotic resistance protein